MQAENTIYTETHPLHQETKTAEVPSAEGLENSLFLSPRWLRAQEPTCVSSESRRPKGRRVRKS